MQPRTRSGDPSRTTAFCLALALALALALGAIGACAREGHHEAPVALLQANFPGHADRVLGVVGGTPLRAAADGAGFVPEPAAGADPVKAANAALGARGGLRARFPARGDGAVRLSLPDGFAVEVREVGVRGAGRVERAAVVYERGRGEASFWSATETGFEEWLLTRPAADGTVAAWDVAGGTLRSRGDAVEVIDAGGHARVVVTAPHALVAGGEVRVALAVEHHRLVLRVADPGALPAQALVLSDPVWTTAASLTAARQYHTATLLPSGKVLVAGGCSGAPYCVPLVVAELYDPGSNSWTTAAAMASARYGHTATLLATGKVLVAAGAGISGDPTSAELYDPGSNSWATAGALATARSSHTATLLPSGTVLVAGGDHTDSPETWHAVASAELYHPSANTWTAAATMATARSFHTATLLPSGDVLVAGGTPAGDGSLMSAELYHPGGDTWTAAAQLATARWLHTATLLPSGAVLVAGGQYYDDTGYAYPLETAALYDPTGNSWTAVGTLATARHSHSATLLPSGKVVVAGGEGSLLGEPSVELYDPSSHSWTAAGALATGREVHTATLLPTGEVLVAGGSYHDTVYHFPSATELYDPSSHAWGAAASLGTARGLHTATPLPNRKVLVAGGSPDGNVPFNPAALYDPNGNSWTAAGALLTGRWYHTATLLPSGGVLVAGGTGITGELASAELYDTGSNTWAATGALATARARHTATLLPSGSVLVTGGSNNGSYLASAERYDPGTNTWGAVAALATARWTHSATLLASGQVLIAGGMNSTGYPISAELYDPGSDSWSAAGALATPRRQHTATLLPSGKVLVAGGYDSSDALASAELYDPVSHTWTAAAPLATARRLHTATLLPSGKVLVAAGQGGGNHPIGSAELYDPASDTWTTTPAPATGRRWHTATLLPSGQVLMAGGSDPSGSMTTSAELYDEGRGAQPAWTPTLAGSLPPVVPGGTLALTGTLFTGVSAASSGTTQTSDTGYPLLLAIRVDNQQLAYLPTAGFTSTSATAALLLTLAPGPWEAWVVVNGVLSNGVAFTLQPLARGAPCGAELSCATFHCSDGFCCDTSCADACDVCAAALGARADGTCTPAPAGHPGDPPCAAPYLCDGTSVTCPPPCIADSSCIAGYYCVANLTCQKQRKLGTTCADGDCATSPCRECASGHCADGLCCDGDCLERCFSCKLPGSLGTCTPSPAGDHDDGACQLGADLACRQACDGAGHCGYPDTGRACAGDSQSCAAGTQLMPAHCNGSGACVTGDSIPCPDGYQCASDWVHCLTDCTGNGDCRHGYYCAGGACHAGRIDGSSCLGDPECASGNCVDGVCCDRRCDGTCLYCNFAGAEGRCQAVSDGDDPRHECQAAEGGALACAGSCQSGQCAYPDVGTSCGTCAACDGNGRCIETPDDDETCDTISCSGLSTACRVYQDLTSSRCAGLGVCKFPNNPATCTRYSDLPCADSGVPGDGGHSGADAGGGGSSGGCGCASARSPRSFSLAVAFLLGLAVRGRRHRSGR